MHDVAVALDEEAVGHLHRADLGDAADVVAAEIEQHQMLGALLRIGEQFRAERGVLLGRLAAPARAGDRADRHLALAHAHQDFRARDDDLEAAEIEEAEIGRRIDAPQRAIERERRQIEAAGEALRQHDLERVARDDVLLRPRDHRQEFGLGRVGDRLVREQRRIDRGRDMIERAFERRDHRVDPRLRRLPRRARGNARSGADRRHHHHLVAHAVEHDHHGRADQDRLGHADRIGLGRRRAAPSGAPCRSRDSRTRPPTSAAARRAGRCGIPRAARAAPPAACRGRGRRRRGRRRRAG